MFPALEAKEALINVSHAYTLDHQHENELFAEVEQVTISFLLPRGWLLPDDPVETVYAFLLAQAAP